MNPSKAKWWSHWLVNETGSLRGRLIKLACVWFIIALIIVSVFLTNFFAYASLTRFQSGIDLLVNNLYTDLRFSPQGDIYTPPQYDPRLNNPYSGLYWQIIELDSTGKPLKNYRSHSLLNQDLKQPQRINTSGDAVHYNAKGPLGEPLRLVNQYLIFKNHTLIFTVAEDSSKLGRDVTTFALITGLALLLMSGFSLLAIYYQVRFGLRPLYRLTDEIADVQSGKQQRLIGLYPTEITPVAQQINAFLDYNQDVVERQRTHVGNLAHALKTPLSVLMTSATQSSPLDEAVLKQTAIMREQVDRHLRRARAAARSISVGERTLVEPVIDELAVMLEQVFHQKGVIIDWRVPEGLYFRGERQDFQEMLANLIENACVWAKKNVRITASFVEASGHICIKVDDDGPGLDASRYDEVIKRGARLDESAPGSGLGLSIVDELVRAYLGDLSFSASNLGGLCVTLNLPGDLSSNNLPNKLNDEQL